MNKARNEAKRELEEAQADQPVHLLRLDGRAERLVKVRAPPWEHRAGYFSTRWPPSLGRTSAARRTPVCRPDRTHAPGAPARRTTRRPTRCSTARSRGWCPGGRTPRCSSTDTTCDPCWTSTWSQTRGGCPPSPPCAHPEHLAPPLPPLAAHHCCASAYCLLGLLGSPTAARGCIGRAARLQIACVGAAGCVCVGKQGSTGLACGCAAAACSPLPGLQAWRHALAARPPCAA